MSAIALRSDFDAAKLRVLAAAASDGDGAFLGRS